MVTIVAAVCKAMRCMDDNTDTITGGLLSRLAVLRLLLDQDWKGVSGVFSCCMDYADDGVCLRTR